MQHHFDTRKKYILKYDNSKQPGQDEDELTGEGVIHIIQCRISSNHTCLKVI